MNSELHGNVMVFELLQAFVVVDIVRMFSVEEEEEEAEELAG